MVSQTLRMFVTDIQAGNIIGKGGSNSIRITKETNVKLKVFDGTEQERLVIIRGTQEEITKAVALIVVLIKTKPNTTIRILIDRQLVRCIVGKGGINVRVIEQNTNVKLFISHSPVRESTENVCAITGQIAENISLAVAQILKQIEGKYVDVKYSKIYRPKLSEIYRRQPPIFQQSAPLLIPSESVRLIIGKGGVIIKEIEFASNTRIQIINHSNQSSIVNITGHMYGIQVAINMIQQIVARKKNSYS